MRRYCRFFIVFFLGLIMGAKIVAADDNVKELSRYTSFLKTQESILSNQEDNFRGQQRDSLLPLFKKPNDEVEAGFGQLKDTLNSQFDQVRTSRDELISNYRSFKEFVDNRKGVKADKVEEHEEKVGKTIESMNNVFSGRNERYDKLEENYWQITRHETFADYREAIQEQREIASEGSLSRGWFKGIGSKIALGTSLFVGCAVLCWFHSPEFRQFIHSVFAEDLHSVFDED